jgi:hypothetical protein
MLPLLPALILLILQGPSDMERVTRDARLPAALSALTRHIEGGHDRSFTDEEQAAIASLLATSRDPELAHALLLILQTGSVGSGHRPPDLGDERLEPGGAPPPTLGRPSEGFLQAQRTRDGPSAA